MSEIQTPKRPTSRDDAVLESAAEDLLPAYAKWCGGLSDEELPHARAALKRAIRWEHDGYRIVKDLEDYDGISGDSELVEIMDGAGHSVWEAEREAEKQWVSANGIVAQFAVGTRVTYRDGEGVIDTIEASTGRYIVRGPNDQPRCGTLVPFEDAAEATEAQS
jgi:hypothetical protein